MTRNVSKRLRLLTLLLPIALLTVILGMFYLEPAASERANGPARNSSGAFVDVAEDAGLHFHMNYLPLEQGEDFKVNLYDHGCGVVVADYDTDGHDDVLFLNQLGPNALYRNRGDGTFTDVTAEVGPIALEGRICVGGTFGDYDNDGDQDLFITTTRGGNAFFENQGNGRFEDVTDRAGLHLVAHSQTAAFFDYDNDGALDLFVTNSAEWTTATFNEEMSYFLGPQDLWQLVASPKEDNILYRNNGDGTFTDVTHQANVPSRGWGGDLSVFDYDEDGHLDLFITNMFGASQLARNNGDGTFVEVTRETLGKTSWGAIGSKSLDIDNDGHLDLYVVDMHSDMWMPYNFDPSLIEESTKYYYVTGPMGEHNARAFESEKLFADRFGIDYDEVLFGNTLFSNTGTGRFEEVSEAANMETFWPWGIATGDFDNDGDQDVFLPSGMGFPFFYWRNYLMINDGTGNFTDAAADAGIEPPRRGRFLESRIAGRSAARSSRCAATGDFNRDGRLDLLVNNFNDHPYYYKNLFPQRNFVAFRLTGTHSNRDAVGAVVTLHLGDQTMVRQVQAAGGYLSQCSKELHFGLGDRSIDRAEVRWPSGHTQSIPQPRVNELHIVYESEASGGAADDATF